MRRYRDWLEQAGFDLEAASSSLQSGAYEWCCFQAQQGAEKCLKAVLLYHNLEIRGHSVLELCERAREFVNLAAGLVDMARELDRHYIMPRYPNSFPSGYPHRFYDVGTARECLEYATRVLEWAKGEIEQLPKSP